jgi:hypothetical protein
MRLQEGERHGWPSYTSHKRVHAAKIIALHELPPAPGADITDVLQRLPWSVTVEICPGSKQELTVAGSVFARGPASPGDFLVIYDDSYLSWSPGRAFETGYTLDR